MAHPDLMIDTSIIIDHLRKQNKKKSILYLNTKHFQRIDKLSLEPLPSI